MERLIFNSNNMSINLRSRTSTKGEEFDMVNDFINEFLNNSKRKNIAIFIEPLLPSGYPDIVIIEFSSMQKALPNPAREKLDHTDLKILFHILQYNTIHKAQIEKELGYSKQQVEKTLASLIKSDMIQISSTGNYVRKREIKSFFKVKKIISIEAKIGKWHDVIEQSYTNQWFSSESYVLLNNLPTVQCELTCKKEGTGIIYINNNKYQIMIESAHRDLPVSYISLLFNEWIYKETLRRKRHE